jgi:hypothetical protein
MNLKESFMETIKTFIVTGLGIVLGAAFFYWLGLGLIEFNIMDRKDSGWYILGVIAFIIVMSVLFKAISDVEYFSSAMMILTMFVGGLWLFYGHGMWFTIGWIAFSLTLESTGCFKALHSGFGNVLGHAYVAIAGKPAKKKYL